MDRITEIGRFFFAVSMVAFGIQQFVFTGFVVGVELVPEWMPAHAFCAYLTGAVLIAAGLCIAIKKFGRFAAAVLSLGFFLCVLLMHLPRAAAILQDGVERTRAFETLAICGGAMLVARSLPRKGAHLAVFDDMVDKAAGLGRFFVAVSMAIFGLDHLLAARFVAALVPSWIPWHLLWVYFTAFGFFAAAISIATRKFVNLVEGLLGLMFLLWVVLLHAPRVAVNLHNGAEWNSAFVAVAMCGIALVAIGVLRRVAESDIPVNIGSPHTYAGL
jgi:uncharacterized membrane protein YphA (DoxX/SURF4 family)